MTLFHWKSVLTPDTMIARENCKPYYTAYIESVVEWSVRFFHARVMTATGCAVREVLSLNPKAHRDQIWRQVRSRTAGRLGLTTRVTENKRPNGDRVEGPLGTRQGLPGLVTYAIPNSALAHRAASSCPRRRG